MKKFLAGSLLGLLVFTGLSVFTSAPAGAQSMKRYRIVFRCVGGRRVIVRVRTRRFRRHAIEYARYRARNRGCIAPQLIRAVRIY